MEFLFRKSILNQAVYPNHTEEIVNCFHYQCFLKNIAQHIKTSCLAVFKSSLLRQHSFCAYNHNFFNGSKTTFSSCSNFIWPQIVLWKFIIESIFDNFLLIFSTFVFFENTYSSFSFREPGSSFNSSYLYRHLLLSLMLYLLLFTALYDSDEDIQKEVFDLSALPTAPRASRNVVDAKSLPTEPPFTAFLGNLPYDVEENDIIDFFSNLKVFNRGL